MQKVDSNFQDYELTRLTHEKIDTLATSITRNCVVITGTITNMVVLYFRIWKKMKYFIKMVDTRIRILNRTEQK